LTLILGGARSGKSRLAQRLASTWQRVTYVATAECAGDAEMEARISRHRADRPAEWKTVEEPLSLDAAVEQAVADADVVLVDCLTVWVSNLLYRHRDDPPDELEMRAREQVQRLAIAARRGRVILVSNEVGSGIVPESEVARAFRDLQGLVNQWAAEAADEVLLVVAGLPLYLKGRQ
jgi:adenosylcobinamide kinase/adenosylcobinamide-phosphate guanylyltransferase